MLQILKGYDLKKMGAGSADTLTAMFEAKRLAYEDLAKWYADPAFVNVPMKGLLSDAYADERRKLIDLAKANPDFGPGDPRLHDGDTIYLTTADKDGMMVSLIQSNYRGMGSGIVPTIWASCSRIAASCIRSIRRPPMSMRRASGRSRPSSRAS